MKKIFFFHRVQGLAALLMLSGFLFYGSRADAADQVTFLEGANAMITVNSTNITNISTVYSELVSKYGSSEVNSKMLTQIAPKVWLAKGALYVPDAGSFALTSDDVTELRISRGGQNGAFCLYGHIAINNVRVVAWNLTANQAADFDEGGRCVLYNEAHNVEFYGFEGVYFGYYCEGGEGINNLSFSNITLDHTRTGLYFQAAHHLTIDNVLVKNGHPTFGGGFLESWVEDSTFSHIRIIDASSKELGATGAYGFMVIGDSNTFNDILVSSVSYSGVLIGGAHVNASSMTVIDAGHNGFEIEAGTTFSTFKDIVVKNSACINFFQVGRAEDGTMTGDITWDNLRSENSTGHAMIISEGGYNTIVKNSLFLGMPASVSSSRNVTYFNCVSDGLNLESYDSIGFITYIYGNPQNAFQYNENHKFIDCRIQNVTFVDFAYENTENTRLINVSPAEPSYTIHYSDYYGYYYVDVQVVDSEGTPVPDALITIVNETAATVKSVNGWGVDQSTFTTGQNGHVKLPNQDRAGSPAIADYHVSYLHEDGNIITERYTHRIKAAAGGVSASVSGVNPAPAWLRSNPDVPVQTIIIHLPFKYNSSDATLSALAVSAGTLSPLFASDTISYSISVATSVVSITVTPTASKGAGAVIRVNGTVVNSGATSDPITLSNSGSTTITVIVTAPDTVTVKTYTITVTKGAASTVATAYTFTAPSPASGMVDAASGNFTVTPNGKYTGTVTITPSGGGLSTPITLNFSNSSTAKTFTITPAAAGAIILTPTNSGGLADPSAVTYTAYVPGTLRNESRNYPNPVNFSKTDKTTIAYTVAEECSVYICLYSFAGDLVKVLVDERTTTPGKYYVDWYGDNGGGEKVASGVYLYVAKIGDDVIRKKIVLLR